MSKNSSKMGPKTTILDPGGPFGHYLKKRPLYLPSGAPNGPQNGPQNGPNIDLFLELFLGCHLGPLLGHFGSQNGTKKLPKSETFLRGPTLLKYYT